MQAVIHHNPKCGTSRNTLALLRAAGANPVVVDYLTHPWTRESLGSLIASTGLGVREVLRQKEQAYERLGLADGTLTDERLLDAMIAHPILINRPIVVTDLGAALCRPSERVLDLLPEGALSGDFVKEDGEVIHAKALTE
ncbi:MAG: arsenate reductase (glutaredoxin) [Rhizobiaceae bacterium]